MVNVGTDGSGLSEFIHDFRGVISFRPIFQTCRSGNMVLIVSASAELEYRIHFLLVIELAHMQLLRFLTLILKINDIINLLF